MSVLWDADSVALATGGVANGTFQAKRVVIDSRAVQPGDLFVAIKGERFDGHEFAEQALAKGAVAAIVSSPIRGEAGRGAQNGATSQTSPPPNLPPNGGGTFVLVSDTQKALDGLGIYNRARSNAKIVGVTGSVGKTSAKEMLRVALAAHGETYATSGNYNNHIGTPLNLANMPVSAQFGVFEMGMNHAGEISHLTQMVRPQVAVITNIEAVHLEFFGTVDKIAEAKAEIFEGLEKGGVAVLNADQSYFADVKPRIIFGENNAADCRLLAYAPTLSGCNIEANISGEKIAYTLAAIGKHFALSSLAVLAVVKALGLDVKKSAAALAAYCEPEGRGRVVKLGDMLVVNDSYNASPASMRAAFAKTIEVWEAAGKKGRKVAVLGDMLELGLDGSALHAGLKDALAGFDAVYTAGPLMKHLHDALPQAARAGHAENAAALLKMLALKPGDVVLIKGSHGSKMYELAEIILRDAQASRRISGNH